MSKALPRNVDDLKKRAVGVIETLRAELLQLSDTIHAHPEIAFEEQEAVRLLTETLLRRGFTVDVGIGGLATSFRATFTATKAGPTVALLAEYDALPELGHACGHNIIATASAGAAIAVSALMNDLRGTIAVIGTPAEEYGGGKITMVENGVFTGVDSAMMVHPSSRTCVFSHALANETLDVEFFGHAAHAAAHPDHGINALDAMILSFNNINALRQQLRSDARVHGIITAGGEASNIIPAHTAGRFQIRAIDDAYLDTILEKVLNCFRAGALATGARLEHHFLERRYQALVTNNSMAEAFANNLSALGLQTEPEDPFQGFASTDMGNVSQVVPGIHPSLAIVDAPITIHSPEFALAARSDRGHEGLLTAAKALAMTAIDLLLDDDLMARVKKEFAESV